MDQRGKKLSLFGVLLAVAVVAVVSSYSLYQSVSNAADTSRFNPGNIMSDAVMSNKNTMSVQQIQSFLDSKNPCNNTKTYMASWYPHLQYNIRDGKFVCMAKESFNGKSAAQLIWEAAQAYNINPQVLIVLLEKEQGLVSDTWPNNVQYRTATGFGCPDTAPCDSQYYGLENQLRLATNLFRNVLNGGWSNYPVGYTYVQYNPNGACGGTVVNIQNRATSALYRYTPYQPNQAALNAGYGTGDGCSAYGNRNFWMLFTDWFGDTQKEPQFTPISTPRWMQIKDSGTYKIDILTRKNVGDPLSAGQQIKFIDKIEVSGRWYLRTEFNHKDGGLYAISQNQIQDMPYTPTTPRWLTFVEDGNRSHPASRTSIGDRLVRGTSVKIVDQITVDGHVYYRTEYNRDNNQDFGIHSRFVGNYSAIPLEGPRNFCARQAITKLDPLTGQTVGQSTEGIFMVNRKTLVNGLWYFQTTADNGTQNFYKSNELSDACYIPLQGPRNMHLTEDTVRLNPFTNERYDTLKKGTTVYVSTKIYKNGQWYFRTLYNTQNGTDAVIPAASLTD